MGTTRGGLAKQLGELWHVPWTQPCLSAALRIDVRLEEIAPTVVRLNESADECLLLGRHLGQVDLAPAAPVGARDAPHARESSITIGVPRGGPLLKRSPQWISVWGG